MHNMKQVLYSVTVQCKEEHNTVNGGSYYLHVVEVIAYFQEPLALPPEKAQPSTNGQENKQDPVMKTTSHWLRGIQAQHAPHMNLNVFTRRTSFSCKLTLQVVIRHGV